MNESSNSPKISIVCPVYNSEKFIVRTLESVLLQTIKPYELVISDDGSTDETLQIVSEFAEAHPELPIRIIRNKHRGPGATRNSGILHAKGNWISFIDSDDVWFPEKLEKVNAAILQHPEINFLCHAEEHVLIDGKREIHDYGIWYSSKVDLTKQLYKRNFFSTSAVTCKKNLLLEGGLFDESLLSSQDYELWLRLASKTIPCFIREPLGIYYHRKGNISSRNALRRWKNLVIIALRYRRYVGMHVCFYKILRTSASMMLQSIR